VDAKQRSKALGKLERLVIEYVPTTQSNPIDNQQQSKHGPSYWFRDEDGITNPSWSHASSEIIDGSTAGEPLAWATLKSLWSFSTRLRLSGGGTPGTTARGSEDTE
jgi:hypothetical protein